MTEYELKHYGVLGMKWGRRKATHPTSEVHMNRNRNATNNAHTTKNTHTKTNSNSVNSQSTKKRMTNKQRQKQIREDLNSMSDKELRERINRMQMEQQYIRMMTPEKSAAKKQVEQFLINEGRNLASQMLREQIRKQATTKKG